jgi:hypothetical protein
MHAGRRFYARAFCHSFLGVSLFLAAGILETAHHHHLLSVP